MTKIFFTFLILSQILFSVTARASGTVVGNGGEPVLHFLEALRFAAIETLRDGHREPKLLQEACEAESALSPEHKIFCVRFIQDITEDLIRLNILSNPKRVNFTLSVEPLLVTGTDGKPFPASARTVLGPEGPIEFHIDSIKMMSPQVLFHLLIHELQHKVFYDGKPIKDNDAIGPIPHGRPWIDAVSSVLTRMALSKGRIGQSFQLRDSFQCLIQSGTSNFGLRVSTQRFFMDPSLVNYQTSLSTLPTDPMIYVPETGETHLVYQLAIRDHSHCEGSANQRQTTVSVWRRHNRNLTEPELVANEVHPGFNPFCEKGPQKDLMIRAGQVSFQCSYYGTEGNSF